MNDNYIYMMIVTNVCIIALGIMFFRVLVHKALEEDKLKLEREELAFRKYQFNKSELNKYKMFTQRLEYDIQKLEKELEIEMLKIQKSDTISASKDVIDNVDVLIKAVVEPTIRMKYTDYKRPLEELNYNDITIPINHQQQEKDIAELESTILQDMPKVLKGTIGQYLSEDNSNKLIKNMIRIYYFNVIHGLANLKMDKAEKEGETAGRKPMLFINGKVNARAGISQECIDLINDLKINSIKQLIQAQESINSQPEIYKEYQVLLSIDTKNYI